MIDEPLQDSACAYALGILDASEARIFEKQLALDPALAAFVREIQEAARLLPLGLPLQQPPAALKARILATLEKRKAVPSTSPAPVAFRRRLWGIAAALAAMGSIGFFALKWSRASAELNQTKQDLANAKAAHQESARTAASAAESQSKALADTQTQLNQSLETARNAQMEAARLLAENATLLRENQLSNARVTLMAALAKKALTQAQAAKVKAVSLWDGRAQTGVLVVENLPILAADKSYQLWVIDPTIAAPVSAGIFSVDAKGNTRLVFQPTQPIANAQSFAVTVEPAGGLPAPTLDQMALLGSGQ
jgi:anti-sigma-K factor RskA